MRVSTALSPLISLLQDRRDGDGSWQHPHVENMEIETIPTANWDTWPTTVPGANFRPVRSNEVPDWSVLHVVDVRLGEFGQVESVACARCGVDLIDYDVESAIEAGSDLCDPADPAEPQS